MSRLIELLARNLGISKTVAGRLMEEGRVRAEDGVVYDDRKATIADPVPAADGGRPAPLVAPKVWVDDEEVSLWTTALVMQHKPIGVVTALRDNIHPTAYDLLRDAPLFAALRPAGRLDLDSSGLLMWSTEGALIQRLTHPKRRVPRTYHAALARPFAAPPADLVLEDGHRPELLHLGPLSPAEAHPGLIIPADCSTLATVTIVGGAYHEVRRLFAALGSHVVGLCRTQFGTYELPVDLPAGAWLHLPG